MCIRPIHDIFSELEKTASDEIYKIPHISESWLYFQHKDFLEEYVIPGYILSTVTKETK